MLLGLCGVGLSLSRSHDQKWGVADTVGSHSAGCHTLPQLLLGLLLIAHSCPFSGALSLADRSCLALRPWPVTDG